MDINEDHPKENMQRLLKSWLQQGSPPSSLAFGRDSKAGREVGKLYSGKKGRIPIGPDWRPPKLEAG